MDRSPNKDGDLFVDARALAIAVHVLAELGVEMLDSRKRRIAFLREASKRLGPAMGSNVAMIRSPRAEPLDESSKQTALDLWDREVARIIAEME